MVEVSATAPAPTEAARPGERLGLCLRRLSQIVGPDPGTRVDRRDPATNRIPPAADQFPQRPDRLRGREQQRRSDQRCPPERSAWPASRPPEPTPASSTTSCSQRPAAHSGDARDRADCSSRHWCSAGGVSRVRGGTAESAYCWPSSSNTSTIPSPHVRTSNLCFRDTGRHWVHTRTRPTTLRGCRCRCYGGT